MIGELILHCFHARTNAHILHLTTRSYAAHKALNEFYDEIIDLADGLAEAYQGEYGVAKYPALKYEPASDAQQMLDDLRECVDECSAKFDEEDTHLNNICDEIRALIASTQYKLRFLR